MILLIEICQKSGVLQTLYILKLLFKITCILVPIFIIITAMISLFKAITDNDDSAIKSSVSLIITKFVIGVIIFFIPLIIESLLSLVSTIKTNDGYVACFKNATPAKISYYKNLEKQKAAAKTQKEAAEAQKQKELNEKKWQEQKELEDQLAKDKTPPSTNPTQDETKLPDDNSPASSAPQSDPGNYQGTLYIGDSRTVGMYLAIYPGSYTSNISKTAGNDYWFASVGKGYSWFKNTSVSQIKSFVGKGNYIVTIQMGANDLTSSTAASSYISTASSLAKSYPNSRFVIISVNPIDDVKIKGNYSVRNSDVIRYNNSLKSAISSSGTSNLSYCDVYSQIINSFSSTDGLHYTAGTYSSIYQIINNC